MAQPQSTEPTARDARTERPVVTSVSNPKRIRI